MNTSPSPYSTMSPEQAASRQEQEQREEQLRDELRLAAQTRHEFVVRTYGTAKAARKLFPEALRAAVEGRHLAYDADQAELYHQLGGSDHEVLETAGVDRLTRSLVAKWICNQEHNLGCATDRYSMLDEAQALTWFDRLVAQGYPLTDAEQTLHEALQPAADEEHESENGEQRDEREDDFGDRMADGEDPATDGDGDPGEVDDSTVVTAEASTDTDDSPPAADPTIGEPVPNDDHPEHGTEEWHNQEESHDQEAPQPQPSA